MLDLLFEYRYREHFHLSAREFACEPYEAIQATRTIWLLKDERDKLEAERSSPQSGNGRQ